MYGAPDSTRSRMAHRVPSSYRCFNRWKVFPPPTNTASAASTAFAGRLASWTEVTSIPIFSNRSRAIAV